MIPLSTTDYQNQELIRKLGIEALTKELGPVGMIAFIRLFYQGEGDYTEERQAFLDDVTFEEIKNQPPLIPKPDKPQAV